MGDTARIDDIDAIREAAREAGADGFLSALPAGYSTVLAKSEGGAEPAAIAAQIESLMTEHAL